MFKQPITGVYVMNAIYGLAGSFVGIFIPIYLLRRNLDPHNVFSFYLVYTIAVLFFFFLANKIVYHLGLRKTAFLGYPFLFLYFFLLYTLDHYGIPLYVLALVNALQSSLYWFPLHLWLTNTSRKEAIGDSLGKFFAIPKAVKLFAPALAGYLALSYGINALFIVSGIIYIFSAIPLFFLPEFPFREKIDLGRFIKLLKTYPRYVVAEIFENIREDAEGILWPVFIYLSFRNILSVGYIGTLSNIGGILFIWIVGKFTDRVDKRKLLGAGALIMLAVWLARMYTITPIWAYVLTLMVAFFETLILIPINTIVYGVAKEEGAPTFILFREFAVTLGRLILYMFALLVTISTNYLFALAALACFGLFYLSRNNLEAKSVVT